MRKVRITYKNALHHVMNKGIKGENIFIDNYYKNYFLSLLKNLSMKYGIEIFAYVLMNNHYHLILRNTNNNLSKFMMELNGGFALFYRMNVGGKGYVFQNRFKSTLIENEKYLLESLLYLYLNPVRAGYCKNPFDYKYSSIQEFSNIDRKENICNNVFLMQLYSGLENFNSIINSKNINFQLDIKNDINEYLGSEKTIIDAITRCERRQRDNSPNERRRKTDRGGMSAEDSIYYIEKKLGIKMEKLSFKKDKRLLIKIIAILKKECLLTYKEISRISPFCFIKYDTLRKIVSLESKK
ncbi:MAG: transposase [bacterium]